MISWLDFYHRESFNTPQEEVEREKLEKSEPRRLEDKYRFQANEKDISITRSPVFLNWRL